MLLFYETYLHPSVDKKLSFKRFFFSKVKLEGLLFIWCIACSDIQTKITIQFEWKKILNTGGERVNNHIVIN